MAEVMDLIHVKWLAGRYQSAWQLKSPMTIMMVLWKRHMPKGVIVHSDRDSQYCSHTYQAIVKIYDLICSISQRGDCYDNAAMESWNHSLKVEARNLSKQMLLSKVSVFLGQDHTYNQPSSLNVNHNHNEAIRSCTMHNEKKSCEVSHPNKNTKEGSEL